MEVIDDFDKALEIMKKDAGDNPALQEKVEELKKVRPELVKAVLTRNHKRAMQILEDAFEIERKIHDSHEAKPPIELPPKKEMEKAPEAIKEKKEEPVPSDDEFNLPEEPKSLVKPVKKETIKPTEPAPPKPVEQKPEHQQKEKHVAPKAPQAEKHITPKALQLPEPLEPPKEPAKELSTLSDYAEKSLELTKKTLSHPVRGMSKEEKEKLEEWNKKRLQEVEEEFKKIAQECERIKSNWKNIEDIKGDYGEITKQVKDVKKEVERLLREKRRIQGRIKAIKKNIDDLHIKKNQEFGVTKDAYKYFWNELLMVSVKLVEIEELLEKNEQVTDVDLMELKRNVEALEKKLGTIHFVAKKKAMAVSRVRHKPNKSNKVKAKYM
ncbi:MAG: hypothetical protein J7L23_04520 [Candidatus Diapherotrites archaeon]|nr:hypothetical protein [Candidatus Diapherotrites archaeon]